MNIEFIMALPININGLITGRGIPKIRKGMKSNGSPEPIFETDDERTYFLTILPNFTDCVF